MTDPTSESTPSAAPKKRRRWPWLVAALLLVLVLAGAGTAWIARQHYIQPGPLAADATLVVERGSGVQAIARQLESAGIVRRHWELLIAARLRESARRLRAGEYAFPAGISLKGALDILESGKTVVRRLTIPEGLTSAQIVELLRAETALSGEIAEVPPDGTLLPETYHFSYGDNRAELLGRMETGMRELLAQAWEKRAPDLPVATAEQAVTLASIVEKETGVAAERPKVAAVFVNRLRLGMRLQSDPTVIYALTEGKGPLDRPLTRADWKLEHPYNTYFIAGLPPGPIANPGAESIRAVLNPDNHEYLYFVADGSGGHAFAETLEEHNRNVAAWRRFQREQGQPAEEVE
ncbi:endolytic transglycosylase MltG [Indioceanicola profundi]|uniref:endolytic transglycosylase MltG n=1 Tax=Indioceanicola profundi TaxID=2220096 RepID=UPI00298DD997|nr:endolytic transglycosylase MltG [Indioceanicola profundi]